MKPIRLPLALALGATLGAAAPARAQRDTAPPLPPPGRLVDVGGWRLHLDCRGTARAGQPTVILEAGAGDFSAEWSLVQPRVATFARVCAYDRAGDGWSDLGPHPRTMRQLVYELHTLLERAGERPPYVLAGQSYGAVVVRLYAATYPADVAGVVLVDGGRLDPWRHVDGKLVHLDETATGRPVPAVRTGNPLREADIPPAARAQIEAAARQSVPTANDPPRNLLPAEAQRMRAWALGRVGHYAAYANPFEAEELALLVAEQRKLEHPLGDRPLVVVTAGNAEYGPGEPGMEENRRRAQTALVRLSSRGRQVIADGSGHHVHIERPALVADAIREVLGAVTR
jgi:pimeloyl-ACP methyl ester carboxylesterase